LLYGSLRLPRLVLSRRPAMRSQLNITIFPHRRRILRRTPRPGGASFFFFDKNKKPAARGTSQPIRYPYGSQHRGTALRHFLCTSSDATSHNKVPILIPHRVFNRLDQSKTCCAVTLRGLGHYLTLTLTLASQLQC
jgi:hypothetical protein